MCSHMLIKMNGWMKVLFKNRWGGTIIKSRVAPQMCCTYSPCLICRQLTSDRFVKTVFPTQSWKVQQFKSVVCDYSSSLFQERLKACFVSTSIHPPPERDDINTHYHRRAVLQMGVSKTASESFLSSCWNSPFVRASSCFQGLKVFVHSFDSVLLSTSKYSHSLTRQWQRKPAV